MSPAGAAGGAGFGWSPQSDYRMQFADPELFRAALAKVKAPNLPRGRITGLVVPHHLVAADLIATGFEAVVRSGTVPRRVIVLVPDHYKRSVRPFATTRRDFGTVFGRVRTDTGAVEQLLRSDLVEVSDLFAYEHGVAALLPFVRQAFPRARIVPVAVSVASRRHHWDTIVTALRPLVDAHTLVVQSTDFSHYRSRRDADDDDQRTLNVLAAGDPDRIGALRQPAQVDSVGAAYIQVALQAHLQAATPVVLAHGNSDDYGATRGDNTTSYLVHLFSPDLRQRVVLPAQPGVRSLCVAGDTFFGRHVQRLLARPGVRARLLRAWQARLQGCPLVVNLEGVLTDEAPPPAVDGAMPLLATPVDTTLALLGELGVVAVGVANNHTLDFGPVAYRHMVGRLAEAGFTVLEHGQPRTVGPLTLLALRDFDNPPRGGRALIGPAELDRVAAIASAPLAERMPPLVVLAHWGREFSTEPGEREQALVAALQAAGTRWVLGAHPHQASAGLKSLGDDRLLFGYTLGNFVFDQPAPLASGAVAQITCFAGGPCATRWIPMPAVFELARRDGPRH